MKKIEKYILEDKKEIQAIKTALNYCCHRVREHNKTQAGDIKIIEKLRRDLGEIK